MGHCTLLNGLLRVFGSAISGVFCELWRSCSANLKQKREVFRRITKTKSGVLITLITQEGVAENAYQSELVDSEVTLDKLFYS